MGTEERLSCMETCAQLDRFVTAMIAAAKVEPGHDQENTRIPLYGEDYPPIGKMPKNPSF